MGVINILWLLVPPPPHRRRLMKSNNKKKVHIRLQTLHGRLIPQNSELFLSDFKSVRLFASADLETLQETV